MTNDSAKPIKKADSDRSQPIDITTRLRQTRANMLGTDDEQHYWDCHDAAAEIERLRLAIRRLADQDATLSVVGGNVTVTMDATLTEAERTLIEKLTWESEHPKMGRSIWVMPQDRETAHGLLERLK